MNDQYLNLEELQLTLGAKTDAKADDYELAIDAASRWIDGRCSDPERGIIRHFWRDDAPTERPYCAATRQLVRVGDFDSTAGMTVEVQNSGVWEPLDADQWQAEPFVRLNGHPYTQITSTDYAGCFPLGMTPRVRVTTQWGWAAIPKLVTQACQILAVANMLGKDVISNEDGYSLRGTGPTDPFALAEHLLSEYLPDGGIDMSTFGQAPGPRAAR